VRIVCAFDGTDAARLALVRAEELARVRGASLTLLAVGRSAGALLEDAADLVGIEVTIRSEPGFTIDELIATSAEYDLLIMGSADVAERTRWLLGSTTDQVSKHVQSDLLVVDARHPEIGPYRRILVGVDGGEASMRAVVSAAGWAKVFPALVTVAHVHNGSAAAAAEAEEIIERGRAAAAEVGISADVVSVPGLYPASVLMEIAEEADDDLIVVGNRGSGAARGAQSVPAQLLHRLSRDLMIVHTPEE
jgi:nucleotide-binding universal stress UspA family protein